MTAPACHSNGSIDAPKGQTRIALVGSPNAGKTSVFNHLTGMRAHTGNYPGVTVTRTVGTGRHTCPECKTVKFTVEDLPGAYSLHPASPDEQVVAESKVKGTTWNTYFQKGLDELNANFSVSNAQKIQKFAVVPGDFTEKGGELTATLKLKRGPAVAKYADVIEAMYK